MTIPNILTLFRILLALGAAGMFAASFGEKVAAALCVLAVLLDAVDGWWARAFSQCSNLGKHLDPLADKIVIAVIYAVIAVRMNSVIIWTLLGLILVREIGVTLLRAIASRRQVTSINPTRLGKFKMVIQSLAGIGILTYGYFLAGGFYFSTHVVTSAMLVILLLAYLSALQYVVAWKNSKVLLRKRLQTRFSENFGKPESLAVGK
ncbi:MAG: hypothetical protein GTO51_06220 [Candidatus Latescibacteria bacterium]|nr:hypothetical protein [Candidatus Latescibacterota bacterium]NIM21386.1 hypothetical protein [Candidatus Latescibacterota bacterium]NIM65567.1 hypothetical protein [Candidatus Latescibacterota bacterium]NIO01947.1 hypothetical protein [Candidatus Latescibacterota bacterium]NIO28760.1 hypothetical protein [Candidatus Latescibacterota bacterium]